MSKKAHDNYLGALKALETRGYLVRLSGMFGLKETRGFFEERLPRP